MIIIPKKMPNNGYFGSSKRTAKKQKPAGIVGAIDNRSLWLLESVLFNIR